MAYVPPALRRKKEKLGDSTQRDDPSLKDAISDSKYEDKPCSFGRTDIHEYYWPPNCPPESHDAPTETHTHSTLNSSAADPSTLKFVMLFREANPRWKTEKILFAKTNLEILPQPPKYNTDKLTEGDSSKAPVQSDAGDKLEATNRATEPIAVYDQISGWGGHNSRFRFVGYHKIARFDYLEPGSPDLVRMLEQKFTKTAKSRRERSAEAWQESLRKRWAVIKFEVDDETINALGAPAIETKQCVLEEQRPKKSVNEMLQEMRLGTAKPENHLT